MAFLQKPLFAVGAFQVTPMVILVVFLVMFIVFKKS